MAAPGGSGSKLPLAQKNLTTAMAGLRHTFVVRAYGSHTSLPALGFSALAIESKNVWLQVSDPSLPDCPIVFARSAGPQTASSLPSFFIPELHSLCAQRWLL